eukprot:Em0007g783a
MVLWSQTVVYTTAKASYEKNKASPSGTGGAMGSRAQVTRKRTKDTGGPEASPHTTKCRPVAKRLTAEHPGRRLTSSDCHNSQSANCTEPLMSDSSNDQGPGTTDGPGDQELDVIGASNVCQNPVEVSLFRHMSLKQAENFSWTRAISKIRTKAPTLFSIMNNFVVTRCSASKNKHKKGDAQYPGWCTAVAILLKERNRVLCGVQSNVSSVLFSTKLHKKTWTQLNHINVTLSYDAILKRVNEISKHHTKVMDEWLREGAFVKFLGDNVDKQCNACISPPASLPEFSPPSLMIEKVDCFLPSREDMKVVQSDMEVLVARILCDYIKDLRQLKKFVVIHIPHTCSDKMADKSEVIVLDVLHKNETKSSDMSISSPMLAIKEEDGERVIRCWKLYMLHFHAERKTKYAFEALRLQFQLATLQPYLVHQLTWGRFVNTHGGKGNMGANFTEFASTRAARAVSSLERLALGFERQTGIHPEATAHSRRTDAKDVQIVVEVVLKARILEVIDDRCHSKFPNFSSNPLHRFDRDRVIIWIKKKAKQHNKISDTLSINSADSVDEDEDEEDSAIVMDEINETDYS